MTEMHTRVRGRDAPTTFARAIDEVVADLRDALDELHLLSDPPEPDEPASSAPGQVFARPSSPRLPSDRPARRLYRTLVHAGNLGAATLLGLAVCTASLVGFTLLNGQHLETVVTGSMQPAIPIGSLVVTDRVSAGDLQPGDVIAFPEPCVPGRVIVHRVVAFTRTSTGKVSVRTKGDANRYPDSWLVNCADPSSTGALVTDPRASADRAVYVIPVVGTALDLSRRFALVALLVTGGVVALGLGLNEIRTYRNREYEPTAPRGGTAERPSRA